MEIKINIHPKIAKIIRRLERIFFEPKEKETLIEDLYRFPVVAGDVDKLKSIGKAFKKEVSSPMFKAKMQGVRAMLKQQGIPLANVNDEKLFTMLTNPVIEKPKFDTTPSDTDNESNYYSFINSGWTDYIDDKGTNYNHTRYTAAIGDLQEIDPDVGLPMYEKLYNDKLFSDIDKLVKSDENFGRAHDLYRQAANSKFFIHVDREFKEQEKVINYIKKTLSQTYSGGSKNIIAVMMSQIMTQGAIAMEVAPLLRQPHKVSVVFPNPSEFDIYYSPIEGERGLRYFQNITRLNGGAYLSEKRKIMMNNHFFRYYPYNPLRGNPYGMPPFAKAMNAWQELENLKNQARTVIDRYSILGVIVASVRPLAPRKGVRKETDEEYHARSADYLDSLIPTIVNGYQSGILIGYSGHVDYNAENVVGDISSFAELYNMAKSTLINALGGYNVYFNVVGKSGSSEATVKAMKEELATSIDDKMELISYALGFFINQIVKYSPYRKAIKDTPIYISINQSELTDVLRMEQTKALKIDNSQSLYYGGYLTHGMAANELGINVPAEDEPLEQVNKIQDPKSNNPAGINSTSKPSGTKAAKRGLNTNPKNITKPKRSSLSASYVQLEEYIEELKEGIVDFKEIFSYTGCTDDEDFEHEYTNGFEFTGFTEMSEGSSIKRLLNWTKLYLDAVRNAYTQSTSKALNRAIREMRRDSFDDVNEFKLRGFEIIERNLLNAFDFEKHVDEYVAIVYNFFRRDGGKEVKSTPIDVSYTVDDARTVSYYKQLDKFYLGKLLSDQSSIDKFMELLEDFYIQGGAEFNNKDILKEFKKNVGDLATAQLWKINRIISTSVSSIRNNATLRYMDEAQVTTYRVAEVMDKKTCAYCRTMHGKTFSVKEALVKVNQKTNSFTPSDLKNNSPILPNLFKSAKDMPTTSEGLMNMNIYIPPFHMHCRGVILVDKFE